MFPDGSRFQQTLCQASSCYVKISVRIHRSLGLWRRRHKHAFHNAQCRAAGERVCARRPSARRRQASPVRFERSARRLTGGRPRCLAVLRQAGMQYCSALFSIVD